MTYLPTPTTGLTNFGYAALAGQCQAIIASHGMPAVLRRGVGAGAQDRWCRVFIRRWNAREMMGRMVEPLVRWAIVGADVDPPPSAEIDRLVTFLQPMGDVAVEDETLRILAPPEPVKPGGVLVFYKLSVRR